MSYTNKTYIIFDGDNDIWAYRYMRGWKENKRIEFNFHDSHDLNTITNYASEATVKRKLKERFSSAKQAIVLIGDKTKYLYRFVRWEIEVAMKLGIPIIAVNLNKNRGYDADLCPPILRNQYVIHIAYRARIIKFALDDFPIMFSQKDYDNRVNLYYLDSVYRELGLI